MKKDRVVIHIDPIHYEIENTEKGFDFILFGNTNSGNGKSHKIIFHFRTWWIKYIVQGFIKIINDKHKELDNISDSLKFVR